MPTTPRASTAPKPTALARSAAPVVLQADERRTTLRLLAEQDEEMALALATLDDEDESGSNRLMRMLTWLVIAVLSLVMVGLLVVNRTVQELNAPLPARATELASTLAAPPGISGEESNMRATIESVLAQANALSAVISTLEPGYFNWTAAMRYLGNFDANTLNLTGIAEMNGGIVLNGQADDERAILTYVDALNRAPQFARVVIQSITMRTLGGNSGGRGSVETAPAQQVAEFTIFIEITRGIE